MTAANHKRMAKAAGRKGSGRKEKNGSGGERVGGEPRVGRPLMPEMYGIEKGEKGTMKWAEVCRKLEEARNYWVTTTRADGRPHAMPVWGFWMDGAVLFGTGRATLKARNLGRLPRAVVHLESGDDVVILECEVREADTSDEAFRKRVDQASRAKYKMPLMVMPETMLFRAVPKVALAWREKDFPRSATRFVF